MQIYKMAFRILSICLHSILVILPFWLQFRGPVLFVLHLLLLDLLGSGWVLMRVYPAAAG